MVTDTQEKSKQNRGGENATDHMTEEMEGLRSDLMQLKEDVVNLFAHVFGLGKSGLGAVGENASDAMEHLKERVGDLKQKGADSVHAAGKKIEENPIQSALIAFGIGFIVAKILGRRR